jgi:thiamine-phosphate pyrophosphorylase
MATKSTKDTKNPDSDFVISVPYVAKPQMKLIVISPEAEDAREHALLAQLFAAGLTSYHLRKPTWTRDQLAAWLRALPVGFHVRIVLHSHHDLAAEFAVGGVHNAPTATPFAPLRSQAVHSLVELGGLLDARARLLFSPVFPSLSKPGYGPAFDRDELRTLLALPRRAEVIALGGIDASRIQACRELGFDGVAVLGAIWQSSDPLCAFTELQNALHAHAA